MPFQKKFQRTNLAMDYLKSRSCMGNLSAEVTSALATLALKIKWPPILQDGSLILYDCHDGRSFLAQKTREEAVKYVNCLSNEAEIERLIQKSLP